ncbi:hypothetical protein, partial [Desulfotomaculum copahuensis]|uniref:hypothetical protein n=1 Tax=Desulfotomaculum copahuensis TaxID=1838280 RepID=UPI000A838021
FNAEDARGTADVLGYRRKDARERYKEPAGRGYGLVRPEQVSRLVIREVCKNPATSGRIRLSGAILISG